MNPLLSIVTINYNNAQGLEKTILSLENSLNNKIEWIIVDGKSSDKSLDILKKYEKLFAQIICEKDKGIYDAMNKGLTAAHGHYVWFLNSGDCAMGQNITDILNNLSNLKSDILYSDCMLVDENYKEIGLRGEISSRKLPNRLTKNSFKRGMVINHQSFICKREIAPLYNLRYKLAADLDWMIKVVDKAEIVTKTDKIISQFLLGGESTKQKQKALRERFLIFTNHFGLFQSLMSHIYIIFRAIFIQFNAKRSHQY